MAATKAWNTEKRWTRPTSCRAMKNSGTPLPRRNHRHPSPGSTRNNPGVILGCTDCHGGDASVIVGRESGDGSHKSVEYRKALDEAHVLPRDEKFWNTPSSAKPQASFARLNKEQPRGHPRLHGLPWR